MTQQLATHIDSFITITCGIFCSLYGFNILKSKKELNSKLLFFRKQLKWIGPLIVIFGLFTFLTGINQPDKTSQFKLDLLEEEKVINKSLPMKIDKDTQISGFKVGESEVTYNVQLINLKKDEINIESFKKEMSKNILGQACSNKSYLALFSNGYSINLIYFSKDNFELTKILIEPANCGLLTKK